MVVAKSDGTCPSCKSSLPPADHEMETVALTVADSVDSITSSTSDSYRSSTIPGDRSKVSEGRWIHRLVDALLPAGQIIGGLVLICLLVQFFDLRPVGRNGGPIGPEVWPPRPGATLTPDQIRRLEEEQARMKKERVTPLVPAVPTNDRERSIKVVQ